MKIGDLAKTHRGNYCIILEVGKNKWGRVDWYNIAFVNGNIRTGFPAEWIREIK